MIMFGNALFFLGFGGGGGGGGGGGHTAVTIY